MGDMSSAKPRQEVATIARRQHGLVTREQCRAIGLREASIRSLVRSRFLVPRGERVLRCNGAPGTNLAEAMTAVLDAGDGALLSHHSAAALWGLPGFSLQDLHVSIPRRGSPFRSSFATVHRHRALAHVRATSFQDIPVVRPEVVVIQMSAHLHPHRLERLLDRAWSERLLSGPSLQAVVDRIPTKGLAGIAVVRELLDRRGPDYVPPASGLEGRVKQILTRGGLPSMSRQVDVGEADHWCGRVDFLDRERGIVLEVDSEKFHASLVDRESDVARDRRLEEAGFVVGRVTDLQVWHHPDEVVAAVRSLHQRARGLREGSPCSIPTGWGWRYGSTANPTQYGRRRPAGRQDGG